MQQYVYVGISSTPNISASESTLEENLDASRVIRTLDEMGNWIGEHDIVYKPRASIKGHALVYLLKEMPDDPEHPSVPTDDNVSNLQLPN